MTPPESRACDFLNQEILSKMVLDAYSQFFRTHSGFAVESKYFATCPPTSCIIRDIFIGMDKNFIRIIAYTFFTFVRIVCFEKDDIINVYILWVGYLSFKLKSIH